MVESPCIAVCRLDPGKEICAGCWRTLPEIARWGSMSDADRLRVLESVEQRRAEDFENIPFKV